MSKEIEDLIIVISYENGCLSRQVDELKAENERLKEALIAADKTFDAYYEGREGQECASAVKVKQALKGE